MDTFVSTIPWSSARPDTLVVCCSDGRWHANVEEFIQAQVSHRADLYAVPGGAVAFDWWISSMEESRATELSFRFLADNHGLSDVWLIAHEACAWYANRYPHKDVNALRQCQLDDLARSRDRIHEWYPRILVHRVYASLEGGKVQFRLL